jgi:hypothetical protein
VLLGKGYRTLQEAMIDGLWKGPVKGSCERGNEPWGFV